MSACDELVGNPKYHVMRSQMIAPASPPRMTAKVTILMSIMPFPTVFATAVPKVKAATKLKNAAQMTALPGDSTRVETTVAIEFAASWKPLMKSKVSATKISAMTARRFASIRSGVLDDHAFDDVGNVLAAVGRLLQEVDDRLPLHDHDGVLLLLE